MSVLRHTKIAAFQASSVVRIPKATDDVGPIPFWPDLRHVKEYSFEEDQDYFRLDTRFNGRTYSVCVREDLSKASKARRRHIKAAMWCMTNRMQEDYGVRPQFTVR